MKKTILKLLLILCMATSAYAQTESFIREYTYEASETDSLSQSREKALQLAKRDLFEEMGVYISSKTEVVNSRLTKDEIISITAGIASTLIISEKWNGYKYWVRAKIETDSDVLQKALEKRTELYIAKKQIETLKGELSRVKTEAGVFEYVNSNTGRMDSPPEGYSPRSLLSRFRKVTSSN